MRHCSYCGKEYPDNTTVCSIDQHSMVELINETAPENVSEPQIEPPKIDTSNNPDAVYPEYLWSARDAWKFWGVVFVFEVLWGFVNVSFARRFPQLHWLLLSGPGSFLKSMAWSSIPLLTAAYFMRVESFRSFFKAVGLDRKPTELAWFGVVAALFLRFVGHLAYVFHLAKTYPDPYWDKYLNTPGFERIFFLAPLLLAAFFEEPVNRGFLYTGFRRSYSGGASAAIVVAYTAYTHWNQYRHFGIAVITLSALTIVQCYLREKSDSLWDIIICHFVFNASSFFIAHIW